LVNNAIKFTSNGGIFISVKYQTQNTSKNKLYFSVEDTGIGISKTNIKKLFKSFSQTDASSTRKYGGTGLGLAISKNLVELMKGEIGVESTKGKGSSFWFEIPYIETPQTSITLKHKTPIDHIDYHKRLNILIVDDNSINRKVAEMTLRKLNHDTDMAINGKEAYNKYLHGKYDIILMDVHMPEMDGLETTSLIRKHEKENIPTKPIPIIAMTAAAMKGDRERFIESGMNDYVSKPFKIADISQVLKKFSS